MFTTTDELRCNPVYVHDQYAADAFLKRQQIYLANFSGKVGQITKVFRYLKGLPPSPRVGEDRRKGKIDQCFIDAFKVFVTMHAVNDLGEFSMRRELFDGMWRKTWHQELRFINSKRRQTGELTPYQLKRVLRLFKDAGFIDVRYERDAEGHSQMFVMWRADKILKLIRDVKAVDDEEVIVPYVRPQVKKAKKIVQPHSG